MTEDTCPGYTQDSGTGGRTVRCGRATCAHGLVSATRLRQVRATPSRLESLGQHAVERGLPCARSRSRISAYCRLSTSPPQHLADFAISANQARDTGEQVARVGVFWRAQNVPRRALLDDPAPLQYHRLPAERRDNGEVVRDEHQG